MRLYDLEEFGFENLAIRETDVPLPGPSEVLVRIRAASLNYRDLMVVKGTYNPRMKLPAIPLSDAAGEIVEVGTDISRWNVGDRVCSTVIPGWLDGEPTAEKSRSAIGAGGLSGVLREYAVFAENAVVRSPEHMSFEQASTLPCAALTAWHALAVSGNIAEDDVVLTLGTGGVSIFALQIAKLFGAKVFVTSSDNHKLEEAKRLGADLCINYVDQPDWGKAVLKMTDGVGVDHVVEVGGTGTLANSVKAVRTGGHIAMIGALDMAGEFNPIPLFMKAIKLQGIFVGSRSMFEDMNATFEQTKLAPVVDREFGFDNALDAFAYMQSGSHFGKVVVRLNDE